METHEWDFVMWVLHGVLAFTVAAAVYGAWRAMMTDEFQRRYRAFRLGQEIQAHFRKIENQKRREDAKFDRVLDDLEWRGSREVVKH